MTARPSRKSVRRARWSSTGYGGLRSDIYLPSQIGEQFVELDTARRSLPSCAIVAQLAASARNPSTNSPAAPKSP